MKENWNLFCKRWNELWKLFFFSCYLPSLGCGLFVELCSRKSIIDVGLFLVQEPLVFLYNVLIIAVTASVCLLFKRKIFVLSVVLFLWVTIGVVDMILLSFRTTPFTAVDLALIKDAVAIAHRYLSWFGVVLLGLAAVAAVALCIWLFRKAKKEERIDYKWRLPFCGFVLLLCLFLTNMGMAVGLLDRNFGNLAQAFHDNGLPYCFMNSVLNTGIERPEDYSGEAIGKLLATFEQEEGKGLVLHISESPEPSITASPPPTLAIAVVGSSPDTPEKNSPTMTPPEHTPTPTVAPEHTPTEALLPEVTETPAPEAAEAPKEPEDDVVAREYPNIIFLQLESFFDVKYMENFSCTEDPIPFFTALRENYPSGFLEVPSIGAGTANTEFECITGMNLDLFGPGEYPYKTILADQTCESMPYILKKFGYSASAMHNNDGTFYNRHEVFKNLGFDRFISKEYMTKLEVNELEWAKDRVLTGQIMKVLSSTKERDFIYAISVQGHGAYPGEPVLQEKKLDIKLPEELSEYYYQYLYYIHQLQEMDAFLKELVLNLSACREEVVLVLYGDHLPSLGLSDELLRNSNAFQTEYIIWSNFALEAEDMDLQSYQLSARVLQVLGMEEGIMPQYHMYRQDEDDYLENMQMLMYDMLYGERKVYEGENPYEPTDMKMGIEEVRIREAYMKKSLLVEDEPLLYLMGQNFTQCSHISINGEVVETIYLNSQLLATAELPKSEDGIYYITVRQQGTDDIILSETEITEYSLEE